MASISGVTQENLGLWVNNGIIANTTEQADNLLYGFNNMEQYDYDRIGEPLSIAIIAGITALVTAIAGAATAVASIVAKAKSQSQIAADKLEPYDFNGAYLSGLFGADKNHWVLQPTGGTNSGGGYTGGSGSGATSNTGLFVGGSLLLGTLYLFNQNQS